MFVWDVQMVINFIKSQLGSTGTFSGREISLKLFMLLTLTRASRASSLHYLEIRYIVNAGNNVTLSFHKLHESWKKGKVPPSVPLYTVIMDMKSCAMSKPSISVWKSQREDDRAKYIFR